MFLFVSPRESFCVLPQAHPQQLHVGESSQVCVCVCCVWSAGVYIWVFMPFRARNTPHPPPNPICFPSPSSLTVNQMAGQFGNSIKAPGFYDYDYGYDDD